MNIVYYRNKSDGKIRYCHEVKDDIITSSELPDKIAEYNQNSKNDTAELYVVTPGSFEEYLWKARQAVKRLNKDTLDDLENNLNGALDFVHDLMIQLTHSEEA
jgi:flagellar hook-basal body complex protein FliE